jgi:hypothetical protein
MLVIISQRFKALLFAACSMCFTYARSQDTAPVITAIAFYNLENLYDTLDDPRKFDEAFTPNGANHYTEDLYRQKLHNLASVIRQLGTSAVQGGPAIIGAAEVENDKVLADLVDQPEIRDRHYQFVHFDGPDGRGIDVALLYRPDMFMLLGARSVPVDLKLSGEEGYTRDVLFVRGILASDTISVLVNHWPSRRGSEAATAGKRAIAARVSRRVVDSLLQKDPGARIIVMGDLNDDPIDASVVKVLKARGNASNLQEGELFNPWGRFYKKGTGTLAYNDSWSLFDQIMISKGFLDSLPGHWNYRGAEVFNREFLKTKAGQYKGYPHRSFDGETWINGYSDHFPTIIYLGRSK